MGFEKLFTHYRHEAAARRPPGSRQEAARSPAGGRHEAARRPPGARQEAAWDMGLCLMELNQELLGASGCTWDLELSVDYRELLHHRPGPDRRLYQEAARMPPRGRPEPARKPPGSGQEAARRPPGGRTAKRPP